MEQYSEELEELYQKIKAAQQSATRFNTREAILSAPITDYGRLKSVSDTFDPFYQFWTTADRCEPSTSQAFY
jgi:dynein heavy chain